MPRLIEKVGYAAVALLLLAPFQNCGKFESNPVQLSSLSQCKAVYRDRALTQPGVAEALACEQASSFACERRVFAPGLVNQTRQVSECFGQNFCVRVDVRTFDTEPARADADASAFNFGGEYNHVESRCYHKLNDHGQSVLDAEDADVAGALVKVRSACARARGGV